MICLRVDLQLVRLPETQEGRDLPFSLCPLLLLLLLLTLLPLGLQNLGSHSRFTMRSGSGADEGQSRVVVLGRSARTQRRGDLLDSREELLWHLDGRLLTLARFDELLRA